MSSSILQQRLHSDLFLRSGTIPIVNQVPPLFPSFHHISVRPSHIRFVVHHNVRQNTLETGHRKPPAWHILETWRLKLSTISWCWRGYSYMWVMSNRLTRTFNPTHFLHFKALNVLKFVMTMCYSIDLMHGAVCKSRTNKLNANPMHNWIVCKAFLQDTLSF